MACAGFAGEGLFQPVGWNRQPLWDPIAGNYRTGDGWIRLHTSYPHHRVAVERPLGAHDRDAVRAAVADQPADEIERAVVAAAGPLPLCTLAANGWPLSLGRRPLRTRR